MYANYVLIYDKRVEISNKYKKILEQNHVAHVSISSDKESFFSNLLSKEPDLIIISESVYEDLSSLCQEIRNQKLQFRPILIIMSKSSFLEDKKNALNAGADDFLSEPIDSDEFLARINAHIRRSLEENMDLYTKTPNQVYSKKIIKRTLKYSNDWAMMLVGFDDFSFYKEIYGQVAAEKVLRAYAAILDATLEYDDYVGMFGNDSFLIITSSYKVEKLADYLNYTFDSIVDKFYSNEDAQRGFMLLEGAKKAGCKVPLIRTSIGIINSSQISYINEEAAINALFRVQKLAKTISGSSKIMDRPLIESETPQDIQEQKNVVIIEKDEDLAYLLETTMRLQGFEPYVFNENVVAEDIIKLSPLFVLIDFGESENNASIKLCSQIRTNTDKNIKIIFTDTAHEKELILSSGADLYLPKPYDLTELFSWIYKLID